MYILHRDMYMCSQTHSHVHLRFSYICVFRGMYIYTYLNIDRSIVRSINLSIYVSIYPSIHTYTRERERECVCRCMRVNDDVCTCICLLTCMYCMRSDAGLYRRELCGHRNRAGLGRRWELPRRRYCAGVRSI